MGSTKQQLAQRSTSSSSRQDARVSRWTFRRACALNSVWLTEGREKMRKVATAIFVLILSGLGAIAATAAPKAADQARTMDDVIDRVITNENRANQQIRQYSPLVETYIQNLKPDKDLGYTPAGYKYFLGRADFSKGVSLVSLTDTNSKGKKIFGSIGNFFSFAMQFLPDGFLQMIFTTPNGFDKQHYKFDTCAVNSSAKCAAWCSTSRPRKSPARAGSLAASGWKIRITTLSALTAPTAAAGTPAGIFTSTAGAPMCSRVSGCLPSYIARNEICTMPWRRNWTSRPRRGCGVTTSATPVRNRNSARFWSRLQCRTIRRRQTT